MSWLPEIEQLWDVMTEPEKKRAVLLLAAMADGMEKERPSPPVVLIRGKDWPSKETILNALASGAPVIRVEFIAVKQDTFGTATVSESLDSSG